MKELLRTTNAVQLSFVAAVLRDAGIETVVMDRHTSVLEGSLGILPQRLMVDDEDHQAAMRVLREAALDPSG